MTDDEKALAEMQASVLRYTQDCMQKFMDRFTYPDVTKDQQALALCHAFMAEGAVRLAMLTDDFHAAEKARDLADDLEKGAKPKPLC